MNNLTKYIEICFDFIVNNLLSTIIVLITGVTLYFTIRTYKFTFKKPLIKFKLALNGPIKYDPAKNPPNERYIRIIITNPSNVNVGIKLEVHDSEVLNCIRGAPIWKKETDNFVKKTRYSGDFLTLESGETIYFDYFLKPNEIDSIRGNSMFFRLTDSKGRITRKKIVL